jgi:hypothetical protein
MVILGNSPLELQNHLGLLHSYCSTWGSKVKYKQNKSNGQILEVVNDFKYLGTVFYYTGNFLHKQKHLVAKALKALHVLFYFRKKFYLRYNVIYLMLSFCLFQDMDLKFGVT